jgi:hypothetical protein
VAEAAFDGPTLLIFGEVARGEFAGRDRTDVIRRLRTAKLYEDA